MLLFTGRTYYRKQSFLSGSFVTLHELLRSNFSAFSLRDEAEFKESYQVLEVQEGCSEEEVKLSFLRLAKQYHPDSNLGTSDVSSFHKVETAYRKLQEKFELERKLVANNTQQEKEQQSEDGNLKEDDYIAPQHRQYLNYGGFGHGTPFDREKQYKKYQVKKAVEHVYDHRMSKVSNVDEHSLVFKEAKAVKKIKTQYGIDRMVEDLIQESMAKGEFSNLKGSGKPLTYQNHNPFVDIVTQKINQVLIDNGFSPQWVMLEKEIRSELLSIKEKLKEERGKLGKTPLNPVDAKKWQLFLKAIDDDVNAINKKINNYNLVVPLLNKQMVHVNISRLAERCLEEHPPKPAGNSSSDASRPKSANPVSNSVSSTEQDFFGFLIGLLR